MTLQLDIYIVAAVDSGQPIEPLAYASFSAAFERGCEWSFIAACKANQPRRKFFEVVQCRRAFRLRFLAHLEARDELAEVLISSLRCAQQRDARRFRGALMRQPSRRRETIA